MLFPPDLKGHFFLTDLVISSAPIKLFFPSTIIMSFPQNISTRFLQIFHVISAKLTKYFPHFSSRYFLHSYHAISYTFTSFPTHSANNFPRLYILFPLTHLVIFGTHIKLFPPHVSTYFPQTVLFKLYPLTYIISSTPITFFPTY